MSEWLQLNVGHFSHFHLLRPWWLLSLIPLFVTLWYLNEARNPMGKWQKVIAPHLLKVMLVRQGRVSWFNPVSISMIVILLGIVAMTGPTWKQQPSPFSEDVAALIIALDVSSSMQQEDIQPSRLERAKLKIQDLLSLRPGGRVGLIVYAGSAHSVIPLTNDLDVINNFLNAVVTEMMPRKGKFPEKALAIADKMLNESPVPGTILMVGDGISPKTDESFKTYFASQSHQLLVLGIGSELGEQGQTNDVLIPLEYVALKKLASHSDGYYQTMTVDKEDVQRLNRRINNYLVIVEDGSRPWVDAGYYLLFPIALIMLLWFRKGWTLNWCIALVFVSGVIVPSQSKASDAVADEWYLPSVFIGFWLTPDQQGKYYLEKGDYKKAAAKFEDIAWRGIAYYRDENFKAAEEMFSRIETVEGYFNLANALAHGRNYVLAVKTYNLALKGDPTHVSALKNRDKIQKIIDEINLLSASQKSEESDSSKELGEDEPQTADGAERQDFVKGEIEQLTAEQIMLDAQLNETWMRQVQKDPAQFLSVKFHMQLRTQGDLLE